MNLKELLEKADKITTIKKVTEGFPHPTENASSMMPQKDRTPSKPKKHIRADTQSEVNFKKENELKKDGDLEKVYYHNDRPIPEKSDRGKAHPENDHQVGHIDKLGNPTWAYKDEVNQRHSQKIMDNFNKLKMSPHGKTKLQKLIVHIAKDPDNHAVASGTTAGAEGKFKELRLRHLSNAMTGRNGAHVKELPDGNIELHMPRHTKNPKYQGEVTTWHFDGNSLKSTTFNPISKKNLVGSYDYGKASEASEQEMGKSGRQRFGVVEGGASGSGSGNEETSESGRTSNSRNAGGKSSGPSWRVKIKGKPGYHPVLDIIPPVMDAPDQSNHYQTEHGIHHQSEIEDLQFGQSLEKVMEMSPSEAEDLGGLFDGFGSNHVKTNKLKGDLYHHVFRPQPNMTHHIISSSPHPHKQGMSEVMIMNDPDRVKEGEHIHWAGVHEGAKGRGLGKLAYRQAIKHHGTVYSDKNQSPNAAKVWEGLAQDNQYKVDMNPHPEGSHKVDFVGKPLRKREKLNKSDDLEKFMGLGLMNDDPSKERFNGYGGENHIRTTPLPGRMFHHVFKPTENTTHHVISYSDDPSKRGAGEVFVSNGYLDKVEVHRSHENTGMDRIAKRAADNYYNADLIKKPFSTKIKEAFGKNEDDKINLVHFSKKPDLKELDPNYMGTGTHSPETRHGVPDTRRTFYYRKGEGNYEQSVTGSAFHKYKTSIPKDHKLHDIAEDTGGIYKKLKADAMNRTVNPGMVTGEDYIDAIKAAGFHGYFNSGHRSLPHVVALFHKQPVEPDLEKGSAKRLYPFKPQREISDENLNDTRVWTSGDDNLARDRIEESPRNAVMRGVAKYAQRVRKHPETGNLQVLLHRGMHPVEYDSHVDGINHSLTSWTPKYNIADSFQEHYSPEGDHMGYQKPKSAWIDVDQIHAIPNTYGGVRGEDEPIKEEQEFIVKPHKMEFVDHEPKNKMGMDLNERINLRSEDPKFNPYGKKTSKDPLSFFSDDKDLDKSYDLEKALPEGKFVFYSDLDNAGSLVEKAVLTDDIEKVKSVSEKIAQASNIIENFVKSHGGKVFVKGGDDFAAIMPIGSEFVLDMINKSVPKKTGFTVTIGYGNSSPRAVKALIYGKITGKNKVSKWDWMKEKVVSDISGQTPKEKAAEILQ